MEYCVSIKEMFSIILTVNIVDHIAQPHHQKDISLGH